MLNCSTCALTQHHCCKASIAFNVMEVIDLMNKAEALGIEVKIRRSKDKQDSFNLVRLNSRNVKSLEELDCIFLKDGKCQIYNERPGICRVYGSDKVKCWFHHLDYDTPIEKIFDMTDKEVKKLTDKILKENQETAVKFFKAHMDHMIPDPEGVVDKKEEDKEEEKTEE